MRTSVFASSARIQSESVRQAKVQSAFADNRAAAAAQRKLAELANNGPQAMQQKAVMDSIKDNSPDTAVQRITEEEEPLQGKFEAVQRAEEEEETLQGKFSSAMPAQLESQPKTRVNQTGLPDHLKSGIESLSGMSMDSVKVHYNSPHPAQLNAHAYAQGSDIHVAPGQEQHLPHEAWHVVQQAQGRVQATMQMKDGVPVNDDKGLEHEADVMGALAHQQGTQSLQRKMQQGSAALAPSPHAPISFKSWTQKIGKTPLQRLTSLTYNPVNQRPGGDGIVGMLHTRVPHTSAAKLAAATNSGYTDLPKAKAAGDGVCNHHVPYKMIKDHVETRISGSVSAAVAWLAGRGDGFAAVIPNTGTGIAPTYNETTLNTGVDSLVSTAANDPRNLFYWSGHSGDGAGTKIDIPKGKGPVPVGDLRTDLKAYQTILRTQQIIP